MSTVISPHIGEIWIEETEPKAEWTVVAQLEADVFVLRYETLPSEPNWFGTEGYIVVDFNENGTFTTTMNDDVWVRKSWMVAK